MLLLSANPLGCELLLNGKSVERSKDLGLAKGTTYTLVAAGRCTKAPEAPGANCSRLAHLTQHPRPRRMSPVDRVNSPLPTALPAFISTAYIRRLLRPHILTSRLTTSHPAMAHQIILYDMATKVGPYSLNTWRTRYALNFKGLPFTTVWLELCDVERELSAAGAPPSGTWPDGRPQYTIARYLDETYPDSRTLFPHGTVSLQHAFVGEFISKVVFPSFPIALEGCYAVMPERTRVYFRETREKMFGKTLEEIWGDKAAVEKGWADVKKGLDWLEGVIKENGDDKLFLLSDTPVEADMAIASMFQWIIKASMPVWNDLKVLNGGRWGRLVDALRRYEGNEHTRA
ncbi:uncharacterized protein SCHCODRAFT_01164723 [Schizophyllum commune H4-8]|nr:uncharacterized protein SCHCODRAFT_01164723 [Schizophyllum commune H4-8]KAI5884889.1 hypothetical protein SCHCODRAFT_01164723 [Schizophyllum commune H4-8]